MDGNYKRKIQIFFAVALALAGLRLAVVFYQRYESDKAANTAPAPTRKLNKDDYVYLRPSHVYDLASAKKFLVGKTVWVKAGNAVAYSNFTCLKCYNEVNGPLPPLSVLSVKDVVMSPGTQMLAVFDFDRSLSSNSSVDSPASGRLRSGNAHYAVPIGSVRNGDYNFIMDDIFYYEDPHKLYPDWTKDQWDAIARHEITKGMSEAMAQAAMGVPHAPEGASSNGEYGNRTLVFTDPAHPDKPVTVTFTDNAAVSITK